MNPTRFKQLSFFVLMMTLTGCLDMNQTVILNDDGSGRVVAAIKGDGVVLTIDKLSTVKPLLLNAGVERETKMMYGAPFRFETVTFDKLSDLRLQVGKVSSATTPTGGKSFSYRIPSTANGKIENLDNILSALKGHKFVFTVKSPRPLTVAHPAIVNGTQYTPDQKGLTATWTIPIDEILKADVAGSEVNFVVDY